VKRLGDASQKRVAKDPKFLEIAKEAADMEKNRGVVKLADIRKKSEADKKKSDEEKKKNNGKPKRGIDVEAAAVQESLRIMTDWLAT
jgi:hypothetical protein